MNGKAGIRENLYLSAYGTGCFSPHPDFTAIAILAWMTSIEKKEKETFYSFLVRAIAIPGMTAASRILITRVMN